ncbi:SDR family NAD(P)-dependent oxidoreductase [Roseovarius sp. B08]|uniref:SDR family NAD(P)-dependent oxidoreductase n=1 Tax=Roseovarius sp. B08 TaxID=3449223 RepID=UPI003EDC7DA0
MQYPLSTPYDASTTAEDVAAGVDLSGKTALVTGGASGLGLETVRTLSVRGARVIVPARDTETARAALGDLAEVRHMDLLDASSILAFSDELLAEGHTLDILILSAGVMASPLFRDRDGHEGQFATNHLGHFRLTCALWPVLAEGARVVVLSSRGHQIPGFDLSDLDFTRRPYDKWLAYGQAKTANALFAVALDRRGAPNIRTYSVHPGSILGPLARHLSPEELASFDAVNPDGTPRIDPSRDMKSPQQGAATIIWCALAPQLSNIGGVYCENCDIAPVESEGNFGVRPLAVDTDFAEALWQESVRMTGCDIRA